MSDRLILILMGGGERERERERGGCTLTFAEIALLRLKR